MEPNNQYNYYGVNYSSSGPFGRSYLYERERSGRSLGQFIEPSENDRMNNSFGNEKPFQILDNSKFVFHTNRKGSKPPIICDEIIIQNETTNYSLDEIEQFSFDDIMGRFPSDSGARVLKENYLKFINILKNIKGKIESEFTFRYKLKFSLQFKTKNIENHIFKMNCFYTAYIPNENPFGYKDENILEIGMSNGIVHFLSEINNEIYNDLEYED
jgi:hypothetical protein